MRSLLLVLFCVSCSFLQAQILPKGVYLEGSLHFGQSLKHRSTIAIDFPDFSYGGELNYEVKTYGKKHWHQRCGFPRWGVAVAYQYSGNAKEMGHCLAVLPNVTIDFFKRKNIRFFGRLGVGLGVVTRPYNSKDNALNNMVSSYLNNNTSVRLGLALRAHKNVEIRPSLTFNHYSNAASTLPNLGLNIISFQLGICYMPTPLEEKDYIRLNESERHKRNKRIQFSGLFSMGFTEISTNSGPKYPVWQSAVDAGLYITRNNRLKAGIEYDYIGASYAFTKHNGGYLNKDLHWQASRISLFVADEIMIGRFAILVQAGVYVTQNIGQPWLLSARLSVRYYFVDPYLSPTAPFITVTMKSHQIVAEYFSMGFGVAF